MTTKEKIQKFQEKFNIYFEETIEFILREQGDFYPIITDLDEPLKNFIIDYTRGGKRIRPFLISFFSEKSNDDKYVEDILIAVELFHLAALIHDDIMDGSIQRRDVPTIHIATAKFKKENPHLGTDIALLLGDMFLTASLEYAHALPESVFKEFTSMIQRTIRGQYLDSLGMNTKFGSQNRKDIMARHLLKTAWYTFGTPARIGYLLKEPDISTEKLEILTSITNELGLLYQIRDDIIDCIDETSGKTLFGDIFENQTTWVTLHLKEHYPEKFKKIIEIRRTKDTEKLKVIFSDIDLVGAYQEEYEKRKNLIASIGQNYQDIKTKTNEVLELLSLK